MTAEATANGTGREDGSDAPLVFVVSTGRCGSTLVSNMIRLNPEILSLSEFFSMLTDPFPTGELTGAEYWTLLSTPHPLVTMAYRVGVTSTEILYSPKPGSRFSAKTGVPPILVTLLPHLTSDAERLFDEVAAFARALAPAVAATQHRRLFDWLRRKMGAKTAVERSGFTLRYLPQLIELFPGARFIHLYRDGRECAYSMSRSRAFQVGVAALRLQETLGVNPYLEDLPASVSVPESLQPLMPGNVDAEAFATIKLPVEDFGRTWSEQILQGLDVLGQLPSSQSLDISYESLTDDPHGALSRLSEFIGVKAPASWIESASRLVSQRSPGWLTLPEADRKKLVLACDKAMSRLYPGYRSSGS